MSRALSSAVDAFLAREGGSAPDFSGCLVLVPHHHAGQAFRLALCEALPGRYLIPPRLLTLPEWAAGAAPALKAEADSVRLAQLRDFLANTGQVPEAILWEAARELLTLVNDLDGESDPEGALARLDLGANRYLSLEAGIARSVWRALGQGGGHGRMRVHAQCLARLLEGEKYPVYTVNLGALRGVERAFFEAWGRHAPVIELPATPVFQVRAELLHAVWENRDPPLADRARAFAASHAENPLDPDVTLLAAPSLEAAARAAERTLLAWLGEGRRNIVLIANDRLMARRLRALLERREILVQDETGWAFSTASASHAVECWLRVVTGNAWFRDLLDFLKSPFVLADDGEQRLRAAHELDEAFRRHGAPDGLAGHKDLARREGLHAARAVLMRIERAGAGLAEGRRPLHEWMRRLLDSLRFLAIDAALRADPVGRQLWRLLEGLAADSAGYDVRYALPDWRRWLFLHLEQSTFLDDTVSSPLRMTHLGAAHTRELEGAIVLGAGARHLPGAAPAGIFNDAARRQLGLPGAEEREKQSRDQLADVLSRVPRVALVWQSEEEGEATQLSPWLLLLDVFHRAAWGRPWQRPVETRDRQEGVTMPPARVEAPAPRSPCAPERLSVSAWQSLVACPYQYFARHVLKLNERDEVPEEMDKADYGSLVHRILARFHDAHPVLGSADAGALAEALRETGRAVFADAEARSYFATLWRQRWERRIDAYLDWALGREREGYRFVSAETPLARDVVWGEGRSTQLHGRADRIDGKAGETVLLDYKTQSRQTLLKKLDSHGEDVQLTAYAWLAGAAEAGFVGVDADKVEVLAWKGDLAEAAQAEAKRLSEVMAGLDAGAPLPAQGAPQVCAWCEMRGLCRRDHWHQ